MPESKAEFIYISNKELNVEIALPGTLYRGSRFDWNGFITQVTLNGVHTFCVPESLIEGRGTGGHGLCGEFGIEEPVGYEETAPGGYFPKIGVGSIIKPDDPEYGFFKKYDFTPFSTVIKKSEDRIEFIQEPFDCNGYSAYYSKKIYVNHNCLVIDYTLKNTGDKPIHTTEYCHNFLRIDGEAVGSGYTLTLPYKPVIEKLPSAIMSEGNSLVWKDEGWEESFYCHIKGYKSESSHSWDLYNSTKGAGIRQYDNFGPARIALWGMKHVISPEVFIAINLQPGEELQWARRYEFYANY